MQGLFMYMEYGYNLQDIQFTCIEQTYVVTYMKMLSKYEYFFLLPVLVARYMSRKWLFDGNIYIGFS